MRLRTITFALAGCLALGLSAAFAALPGPHRALAPGLFGLSRAGPDLWVDIPARAADIRALAARADETVQGFFGPLETRPRRVFCTTQRCAEAFGLKPRALSYGYHLILIGPEGVNATIVTHERTHAELHRSLGLSDLWDPRIPAWFDEGLATHLAGAADYDLPTDPRAADWICAARTFRDWGRLHGDHHWRQTYGAAARLVREIEDLHGRDALRALVGAVEAGAEFDAEYARLVPGAGACSAPPS